MKCLYLPLFGISVEPNQANAQIWEIQSFYSVKQTRFANVSLKRDSGSFGQADPKHTDRDPAPG